MTTSETDYRQQIAALQERLQLQELMTDISDMFVNLPASEVDGQIELGLKHIVEFLGIDRTSVGEFSEDMKVLRVTHSYAAPGIEPVPKWIVADLLPWFANKLQSGEIIAFERPSDLPEEAAAEKAYCQQTGLKSNLAIPAPIGGSLLCGLSFGSFRAYRAWPDDLVEQLKQVAEIFAHAIYRKRAEQRLENQYQFERLISELSARFVNISPDQVDREIENALRQILAFFQADRCGLLRFSRDKSELHLAYICYADEGIQRMPDIINDMGNYPWNAKKLLSGETVSLRRLIDLPPEAALDRQSAEQMGIRSYLAVPLMVQEAVDFIIVIDTVRNERTWPDEVIARLRLAGEIFMNALARKRAEEELQKSYREIKQLKDRLQAEAEYLHSEIKVNHRHGDIVGESAAIRQVLNRVEQVAPTHSSVLISGETGTGKELIAQALHNHSPRKQRVMMKVNCVSLPAALIENELFGREKGAYTGAMSKQIGRFEVADGSTIFLDEIGELSLEVQSKLLRVLQEGEFERLGNPKTIKVDVRVIAATNRDLAEEMQQGRFREDLFYRLNVFPIKVPPLRERCEDIPLLVWAFIKEFSGKMGKKIELVPQKTMEALERYHWPGNIRQLHNVIEHAMIISTGKTLQVQLPESPAALKPEATTLEEVEIEHIIQILEKTNWRIRGRDGAAELLNLNPGTLYSKMRKLGIPHHRQKVDISTKR